MAGLVTAGALAACWSGAGPSLLGICTAEDGPRVREAGDQLLKETGVPGRALLLEADHEGVVTG
jgi:homoserine kinase